MSVTTLHAPGVFDTGCRVRVEVRQYGSDLDAFNAHATFGLGTGACSLQTYLTAAECAELAAMLLLAARELRDLRQPLEIAA